MSEHAVSLPGSTLYKVNTTHLYCDEEYCRYATPLNVEVETYGGDAVYFSTEKDAKAKLKGLVTERITELQKQLTELEEQ